MRKVSYGHLPFKIHVIVTNDSVSGQRRPCSDCADAQADLGLSCPHMSEDTFSHDEAYVFAMYFYVVILNHEPGVTRKK